MQQSNTPTVVVPPEKISAVIASLQCILEKHGDRDCFNGDMKPGANVEFMIGCPGDVVEEGFENFPDGFVHLGSW